MIGLVLTYLSLVAMVIVVDLLWLLAVEIRDRRAKR